MTSENSSLLPTLARIQQLRVLYFAASPVCMGVLLHNSRCSLFLTTMIEKGEIILVESLFIASLNNIS